VHSSATRLCHLRLLGLTQAYYVRHLLQSKFKTHPSVTIFNLKPRISLCMLRIRFKLKTYENVCVH
jgi:hypothetical protein